MIVRIFVAFDLEHDQDLYEEILANARDRTAFEVSGRSEHHPDTDDWQRLTLAHISAADQVVVACGEHTGDSASVAAELRIAQEQEKPVTLLWSRREAMCKKPMGALPNDCMYSWTPDILRDQLATNRRNANKPEVPARLKRKPPPAAKTSDHPAGWGPRSA